jgi:hypothetical protein
MSRLVPGVIAIAILLAVVAPAVQATPIVYNFSAPQFTQGQTTPL